MDKQCLTIVLHKVKAHSGDLYNEKVDQLAKQCYDSSALLFNLNYLKHHHISYNQHLFVINEHNYLNIHWLATAFI